MTLTGGFIRNTKNSYWVSRDTRGQIQMGVDSAVILWQNRDSDLQTFPYITLYLSGPYSFADPVL